MNNSSGPTYEGMNSILMMQSPFRSLRHFVTAFILVVVLPGMLLGMVQTWWSARQLIDGRELVARHIAIAYAESMGHHLGTMTGGLTVLSQMPLGHDHLASFYTVAKAYSLQVGYHVTLADKEGNQFLSTRLPFGEKPPKRSSMDSVSAAVASGQPHVSDMFQGKILGRNVVTVDAPVQTPDGLRVLTLTAEASVISDVLLKNVLLKAYIPKDWLIGLIDGRGIFIARSKDPHLWVGKPARPELIEATRNAKNGALHNQSVEGFPILNAFSRVPGTSWTVLVGIPESVLFEPLVLPLALLAAAVIVSIALTVLLALRFARQFSAATNGLIEVARDPLATAGNSVLINPFTEFEEIAETLRKVAVKRQQLTAALDLSAALGQSNTALTLEIDERKRIEQALHEEKAHQQALIHKLEEAQNQLLQSEKMASIGQLAAGVAHEINNPISFVSGNLGMLGEHVENLTALLKAYETWAEPLMDDHPDAFAAISIAKQKAELDYVHDDLPVLMRETREGVQRVRDIVRDLREFSHVGETAWQLSDLHKGLDSTLNVVRNEIKYTAKVVKEYGEIPLVECVASQINQVFMNLLVNAGHAITDSGVITLRSGQQNNWVWVEIADTGSGIAPENLQRIFEPFFTTKPVGKGTGLGLSVSFGIVRKHNGRIEVQSEVGKGTTFRIWLPVSQSALSPAEPLKTNAD